MVETHDQEIRRLCAVVTRNKCALNLEDRKWKPEVLKSGEISFTEITSNILSDLIQNLQFYYHYL